MVKKEIMMSSRFCMYCEYYDDCYCHSRHKSCLPLHSCNNFVVKEETSNTDNPADNPKLTLVPFDMLYDIIKQIGSVTYGKERFFEQGHGIWYDRKHDDYITLEKVIERLVEAVKESCE